MAPQQNAHPKKRAMMMGDSDDVIEVPPPDPATAASSNSNRKKGKKVITHEVIDVDDDGYSSDVLILGEKVDTKKKGKNDEYYSVNQAKDTLYDGLNNYSNSSASESQNVVDLDNLSSSLSYDDEPFDPFLDDSMDLDFYSSLQAHFDNVDLPAGVEAPFPLFPGSVEFTKKSINGSDSSSKKPIVQSNWDRLLSLVPLHSGKSLGSVSGDSSYVNPSVSGSHASGVGLSSTPSFLQNLQSKENPTASFHGGISYNSFPRASSSSSTNYSPGTPHGIKLSHVVEQLQGGFITDPIHNNEGFMSTSFFDVPAHLGGLNHSPTVGPPMSWPPFVPSPFPVPTSHPNFHDPIPDQQPTPVESQAPINVNVGDILRKFRLFKRFDTVEDHSDHHYASRPQVKQPQKSWVKKIQEEWRILENDLPEAIFVRVYETRMDLLRAVIVGADGTPYHDGLFFFDILFPRGYPSEPPLVYYHSGGLRLNPNLYSCGKVCLSLLGTWQGNKNERWLPDVSTVLQVLVSIQALILNQKPYFNEPGYAHMSGSVTGEMRSQQYNEQTFILSLKTMVYTMRNPPKNFEDFVMGHFFMRAHDILVACKAYMDGAQVGCLVKGGVQDVDEGDKSCSKSFKNSLPQCVGMLLQQFSRIGFKDTEKFQELANRGNNQLGSMPKLNNLFVMSS